MSARAPRRSFASPFVVTLAASLPVAACIVESQPRSTSTTRGRGSPGSGATAQQPPVRTHTNPPRPGAEPATHGQPDQRPDHGTTTAGNQPAPVTHGQPGRRPDHGTTTAGNQPAPPPITTISNPPPPQPVPATAPTTDRRWTISMANGTCRVFEEATCPPNATCNPPPPQKIACIDGMVDGQSVKVVQRAGQTVCMTVPEMPKCPPKVMCNPPPPRKVACPR